MTLQTYFVQKIRRDVKVLLWMWSCWRISNRNEKNFENYKNEADELTFKMLTMCLSEIECIKICGIDSAP